MAQKYYEFVNYKEEHVQEQQRAPRGACNAYVVVFQTVFYVCFHVRAGRGTRHGTAPASPALSIPRSSSSQLSFVCAQMPMLFFLNNYLYQLNHTLYGVKHCGERWGAGRRGALPGWR